MAELITPDICVIGAGAGGLSVAAAAAAFGVPVVLIEKGRMGGECLNSGCVPSKALIAAARRAHGVTGLDAFGITASPPQVDFARVHDHIRRVIAAIAPNNSKERFTGLGVRVIEGRARFKDKDTVAVGDDIEIKARRVVIATGSSPAIPAIPGLNAVPFLTNETVFDLTACPQHLIVLGGGPMGLELAQAFAGSARRSRCWRRTRRWRARMPSARASCSISSRRRASTLRQGVSVARVEAAGSGVAVVLGGAANYERITGSDLLIATGRRAQYRGPQSRCGRHRAHRRGHHGRSRPAHLQPPRLCHRRRRRRAAVHPRRQLSCRPRHPECAVPFAGEGRRPPDPARDLHRPGAGACRPHRGRGPPRPQGDPGAALAVRRERPRPGRAQRPAATSRSSPTRAAASSAPPSSAPGPAS